MTTPRTNFLQIAQTLAAYVAIPVALVYPFGFVALFLQFMRYFGLESYTSWYAVSLVNRTIVIGQGATILIVALIGSVLLAGMVGHILLRYENRTGSFVPWVMVVELAVVSLVALVLYVLYSRILATGRMSWSAIAGLQSDECRANALRHQLNFWPDSLPPAFIFVLGVLLGGFVIYGSCLDYRERANANERHSSVAAPHPRSTHRFLIGLWILIGRPIRFFVEGVTQRWILPGLTVTYIFAICASLWLAWATPAFMPYVNFGFANAVSDEQLRAEDTQEQPAADGAGGPDEQPFYAVEPPTQPTSDRYLSHAAGHWHFLHRGESTEGTREYRVISLREYEVSYARVVDAGVKGRVAPFPWQHPSTSDLEPCSKFNW